MNLKPLKALSSCIKAKQEEIDLLLKEKSRCEAAVAAAGQHQGEIDALLRQGAEEKAKAFLARTEADTLQLERRIAELESKNAETLQKGRVAQDALALLEPNFERLQAELAELNEHLTAQTIDLLRAEFKSAEEQYSEALNGIRVAIERLLAIAGAHDHFPSPVRLFRSAYQYVITNRDENLSDVAARSHVSPAWLSSRDLGDAGREKLLDELAAAGLPLVRPKKQAA